MTEGPEREEAPGHRDRGGRRERRDAGRRSSVPLVIEGRLLGWIRIKYSLENIRAELEDNFRGGLYALLWVFAVGLVVILVVTRNATRPIEAVAEAARQVADGHLDVVVPVDRADEVGQLAVAFNRMTSALRERQDLLARLAAAEKRAEIGHLAAGLAHEIKNPLNALSLGLDVLKRRHRPADEAAAADQAARIEALRGEINRLAALINSFLAFGRPLSLTIAPVDAVTLVRDTLADLAETAERARVTVDADLPDGLPRVPADGSLLKSARLEPRPERHPDDGAGRGNAAVAGTASRRPRRGRASSSRSRTRGRDRPATSPPVRAWFSGGGAGSDGEADRSEGVGWSGLDEGGGRWSGARDGEADRRGARRPGGGREPRRGARGRLPAPAPPRAAASE